MRMATCTSEAFCVRVPSRCPPYVCPGSRRAAISLAPILHQDRALQRHPCGTCLRTKAPGGLATRRSIEHGQLLDILTPMGLRIHDIPSDGHCMYRSLEHQIR